MPYQADGNSHTLEMCIRDSYNPFSYIHSEKDILKLVTALILNTKGEGKGGDDFWVIAVSYTHLDVYKRQQKAR